MYSPLMAAWAGSKKVTPCGRRGLQRGLVALLLVWKSEGASVHSRLWLLQLQLTEVHLAVVETAMGPDAGQLHNSHPLGLTTLCRTQLLPPPGVHQMADTHCEWLLPVPVGAHKGFAVDGGGGT